MQNLIDTINSKIDSLNSDIESILYDEFLLTLQDIRKEFKENSYPDLDKYFKKLDGILSIKKDISSNILSYDCVLESNSDDNYSEELESEETIAASSNLSQTTDFEELESTINSILSLDDNSYYFHSLSENYGEIENSLNLCYSITSLENFNLFSLKISGIKLFDNIFIGRTISTSMPKLMSFLFSANENPFITLCEKNSKFFAKSPSNMKRAITLKENHCYIESDVDDSEASEMIKTLLRHIDIPISACKVLLSCSTTKPGESYITFVL